MTETPPLGPPLLSRIAGWAGWGIERMLIALLAIPLLMLLLLVCMQYGKNIVDTIGNVGFLSVYTVAVAAAAALGAVFWLTVNRKEPFNPVVFLCCSLTAAAIAYGWYVASIKVAWISDFQTMWRFAVDMVASGDFSVKSIYNERSLPVLVPAVLIFGPEPAIVPYINIAMLLSIQLAGYDLARRISGHRAAQGFTVLWIGAVEPVMALPITSHDIWGLFFLTAFVWGFKAATDALKAVSRPVLRAMAAIAAAVVLAALLTLLDMQRELAPIVVAGFALAVVLLALRGGREWLGRHSRALMLLAAVFLLHFVAAAALKQSGHMLTAEQARGLSQIRLGAYSSSLSNGQYQQGQILQKAFFYKIGEGERKDLARSIPLSDLVLQPVARFSNIVYRAREQARLGSQTYFYHAKAETDSPRLIPFVLGYNISYSMLLALLSVLFIVPTARRSISLEMLGLFGVLSVLIGGLLLFGESQPRYVFPIWFVVPQLVSYALSSRSVVAEGDSKLGNAWGWDITVGAILAVLGFLLVSALARAGYSEKSGRVLSDWSAGTYGLDASGLDHRWFRANQAMSATDLKREAGDTRAAGFGKLALVMRIPVNAPVEAGVTAEKTLCVGQDRRSLDFFYYMPYQNPNMARSFTLRVLLDDRPIWSASLPGTTSIQHARIPEVLPAGSCGKLTIDLRTHREIARPSWITATQTDLYFMRLVR